ncbi:na+ h+ exchanger nhe3, partial [Cystoisospora suis]
GVFNSFSLLAETVVFVFLGLAVFTFDTHYEGEDFSSIGLYALGFIATFTARGVSVYVTCCLINFFRNSSRITSNQQIALILCGLRGAIAFALSERARRDFGGREGAALLSLTLYLALFTILVVGPSLVYFLDRLGIFEKHRGEGGEYEEVKERGRRGHRHYDQRGGSSSFHPPENSLEALASLPSRSTTATSLITTTTTGGVRRKKGGALVVEEEESCRQLYGRSRACGGAEGSSRYRGEARYDLSVLQGRQERGGVGSRNVLMREEEGGEKGYTRRRDPIIRPGNANQDAHDEEDDIHDEEEEEESLEAVTRGTCGGLKRLLIQIDRRFMIPVFTHHRPFYRHSRSVSLHAPPPRVPLPPFSSSHRSFVWWSPVRRRLSFLFHSSSPPTSLQPPQRERERFTGSNAARRPRGGKEEEQENLSSSSSSSSGGKMTGRLSSVLFKTKSSGEEREEMTGVTITGKPSMRFAMKDRRFLIANRRFDSDSSSPPPTAPSHETSASHRRWLATLSTGSTSSNATHGVAENTNLARKKNALSSSSDATSTPPSISGPYKKKKRSLYDRGDGPRADRVSTRSSTRYIRMVPTSSSSFRQEEEEEEERRERRTGRGVAGGLSWAGLRRSLGVVVRTQEEEEEELERLSEVFEDDFDEEEEEEEEEERRTVSYASSSSSRQEQQGREREEEEEGVKKIEEDLRRGEEVKVEDERGEKVRDLGEGIEMMRNHTNHHYHEEEEEEFNGERKKRSVDVSHDDGDSSSSSLAWNGVDPSYHGGKKDPMKIAGHSVKEKKNALLPLHPSHSRNPPGADQQEEERDDERENREEKIDLLQEEEDEGDAFDKLDGDLNESKKKNGIPMIMVSSHDKKASSFTPPATTGPLNHLNNAVCHEDDSSIHPFVPCPLPAEVTPLNRSSQMSSTLHHPQPLPVLVGRRRSIDKKIGGEEEEEEEQEERRRMIKNKGRDGEMNGVH